ncbi:uncharacterized protein LOC124545593 [Schistocerca americana]|uniref:uncharacterized protein LOC124545593 n=1 Tax=Schistocerca americana TaxID=7009 RepID=UPI001F4F41D1|nr:uncharacterized protein LOC124545593 [Schistocerca americana]
MKNAVAAAVRLCLMVTVLAAEPDKEDDDGATVAVPKCRRDSPDLDECLQRALQASLPLLLRGNPDLGLPALQPLLVDKLDFGNKEAGLRLKLRDVRVSGIANSTFHGVRAKLDDYTVFVGGKSPLVTMTGRYKINFTFEGEKIEGKGRFEMNLTEVESKNVLHGVKSVKEGRHYVDVHLDGDILSVAGLSVRFHGLFTGDKDKEEQANRLLNEHWQQLWSALEPALDAAYNRLLSEISGKALAQLPLAAILDDP